MDVVKTLKDLIRIDTSNPPGREEKLLRFLEKIFIDENIDYVYQETAPKRGNILAWVPATQKEEMNPLILLSHIDVVGAVEEQWIHPPFQAVEENGYIYGRGTVDTKQLTVMELQAFLELKKCKNRKRDVYFIATSDEESGSEFGIRWLLEHKITINKKKLTGIELFRNCDVISEGGGFPVKAGDKEFYLCESGQKACSTVEFVINAKNSNGRYLQSGDGMLRAMSLIEEIGNLKLDGTILDTVKNFEDKIAQVELSPMMQKILEAMKHNTMTVTMVTGENLNEIVVTCDVRLLPGYDYEYLKKILNMISQKWDCEYRIKSLGQGYECNPDGEFLRILESATLEKLAKTKNEVEILPFVSMGSSDGHYLVESGAKIYGYSPVYSWDMTFDTAVTMVHGVDERIHKDSLILGADILTTAVRTAVETL